RSHRLPQHLQLDYTLIPAPLDLSLSNMTEKSPLPAIIVTPSSPSSSRDFSIAFLAPPPKPSLRKRIANCFQDFFLLRSTRTTVVLILLFFLLLCHYLAHRLAVSRSGHMEFVGIGRAAGADAADQFTGSSSSGTESMFGGWWNSLSMLWGGGGGRERATDGSFATILETRSSGS
ncbi:hypothetical protein AMATHDRAFT_145343, partial [Amanita thiersii Skay4041]